MIKKLILLAMIFGLGLVQSSNHQSSLYSSLDNNDLVLSFLVNEDESESALQTALSTIDSTIILSEYRELANDQLPSESVCDFNMASIVVKNTEQAEAVRKLDTLSESVSWVPSSVEAVRRLGLGSFSATLDTSSPSLFAQNATSSFTGKGVRIAVLDTGFTTAQWVLNDWETANAINLVNPLNLTSDDPSDFFDGFVSKQDSGFDYVGHGTAIAALSGANHPEFRSAAPNAEVMPIKVCNDEGDCLTTHVIQGLCYALNNAPWSNGQADLSKLVINLSFGTPDASKGIYDVLEYALSNGASVVVSGGNDGENGSTALYPAAFGAPNQAGFDPLKGLVVVGSVHTWGEGEIAVSSFSTRGTFIDIAALGEGVFSSDADALSFSNSFSGTSFAAPQVTAALAQLKEELPNASPQQLESTLKQRAKPLDCADCSAWSVGAGLLNLGSW